MFVLGDLNADPKTNNGNKLIQLCLEHNLQYLINEPTRITATSQTILDQVLTNAPKFISSVSVSPPLSTDDHCTIIISAMFTQSAGIQHRHTTGIHWQQAYTCNRHTQAHNRQPFNTCLHILPTAYCHTAITHTPS